MPANPALPLGLPSATRYVQGSGFLINLGKGSSRLRLCLLWFGWIIVHVFLGQPYLHRTYLQRSALWRGEFFSIRTQQPPWPPLA